MITRIIDELIQYGLQNGLIAEADKVYTTNRLLELFNLSSYTPNDIVGSTRPIHEILDDALNYAVCNGLIEDDTITTKDLFDTRIMGLLTPPPSYVRFTFANNYSASPVDATNYYYNFSKATNYIRRDRIAKDEKWVTATKYGEIDITINLSKPEKDPRDIAKALKAVKSGYPSCLLCRENEGYAGHATHPARQNHRIIPVILDEQEYFLQYSPYVYYNEHCIVFNKEHTPMVINRATFVKLLDFVKQFPHYMIGSNADLPIVGGSILTHDHFQGGNYTFAMAKAPFAWKFTLDKYPDITAGVVDWPMSVIRLQSRDVTALADASDYILNKWRSYTDEDAYIYCQTNGEQHNTITPIARVNNGLFEIDLVLRNNITTDEHPSGLYHPHARYHHIKKENIGLIEVMGLAVLPARLKSEIAAMEDAILNGDDISQIDSIAHHADWVKEWIGKYSITKENIREILQKEIGLTFSEILECAGVYKRTDDGEAAFKRFLDNL